MRFEEQPVGQVHLALFVTGASRSGTTMLNRILGNHDQVLGLQELHFFGEVWDLSQRGLALPADAVAAHAALLHTRQINGYYHAGRPRESDIQFGLAVANELKQPDGLQVFLESTRRLAELEGKRIACEQTPRNIYYAKQLLDFDDRIRVIQLIRDPRAVVASQKNRWRRKRLGGVNIPWSEVIRTWSNYHPRTMSKLWLRAAQCGAALRNHPRFIAIRYEDLVASPEVTVRRLCEFSGLTFQPTMLDVPVVGSSQTRDSGQRGVSARGVDAWMQVLTPCEVKLVEEACGPTMQKHGYQLSNPSCSTVGAIAFGLRYPLHLAFAALSNPRQALIQARAILTR